MQKTHQHLPSGKLVTPIKKKKKLSPISINRLQAMDRRVLGCMLFNPNIKGVKHWTGVVTTDGISASWHLSKTSICNNKLKKSSTNTRDVKKLSPTQYGVHNHDVKFNIKCFDYIAVDPGHATLVAAVRVHKCSNRPRLKHLGNNGSRKKRRLAKEKVLSRLQRSEFSVTNKTWRVWTGLSAAKRRREQLYKRLDLNRVSVILSKSSSKTTILVNYLNHVKIRFETLELSKLWMNHKRPR